RATPAWSRTSAAIGSPPTPSRVGSRGRSSEVLLEPGHSLQGIDPVAGVRIELQVACEVDDRLAVAVEPFVADRGIEEEGRFREYREAGNDPRRRGLVAALLVKAHTAVEVLPERASVPPTCEPLRRDASDLAAGAGPEIAREERSGTGLITGGGVAQAG